MSAHTKKPTKLHTTWSPVPPIHLSIYLDQTAINKTVISKHPTFAYTFFPREHALTPLIEKWLAAYLQKRTNHPDLPLAMNNLSPYTKTVLKALKKIPLGHTASYAEIASAAMRPKAYRAVGNICHHNPFPLLIPCHRVVRSNGTLGGFAYDLSIKSQLLAFEKENS